MAKTHANTKELDWNKLDAMLQFKPTLQLCADYLGVSGRFIELRIQEKYDLSFGEYRETKMASVKMKLVQKAISMAISGNATMLIFCLKNLNNWADKIENKIEEVPTRELIAQAKDMIKQYEKEHEPIEDEELEN